MAIKLTLEEVLGLWTSRRLINNVPSDKTLFTELMTSRGLPLEVSLKLMAARDKMLEHLKRFDELREQEFSKLSLMSDGVNPQLIWSDDAEGRSEEDLKAARAQADEVTSKLLEQKVDGFQPIRVSLLLKSTGEAEVLMSDWVIREWLRPLINDDSN